MTAAVPLTPKTADARRAAAGYPSEMVHMEQVACTAAMFFGELSDLHGMGRAELELLCSAALLHDIGISVDYRSHHKKSRKLIMTLDLPSFTTREREIVANVARYHRKARPAEKHKAFRALLEDDRELVRKLAAILRPADGLDRAHENAVNRIVAGKRLPSLWNVALYGPGDLSYAAWAAERKAGLFEEVFGVRCRFEAVGPALDAASGHAGAES